MSEADGAKKAIQDPNPVIDGRKANVNLAYLGAKPRGVSTTGESLIKSQSQTACRPNDLGNHLLSTISFL